MEPTSQVPQQAPEQTPEPVVEQTPPLVVKKKSKKPFLFTLLLLVILVTAGAGWYWWNAQQTTDTNTATDQPASNAGRQTVLEPFTVAYSYDASNFQSPSDLFWRPAGGGERQNVPSKAFVGTSAIYKNQIAIDTYGGPENEAPSILYSSDGGKSYKTIFTGKKSTGPGDMGDQITSMVFSGDGKSIVFALLPSEGKNTVKQIFFDKPSEVVNLMTSDMRGVFVKALSVETRQLIFSEGCYNCDGNVSNSILSYSLDSKKTKTLLDGTDKHLVVSANRDGSRLLVVAPTVDKAVTATDSFFGYYVGAPYLISTLETETNAKSPDTTVGTKAENKYVRAGFMTDGTTPYYYSGNQLYMFTKKSPELLYESSQPLHQVFYVSDAAVFASTGTHESYTLNRFGVKSQDTNQLLTGDDTTTRVFGITEH